MAPRAACRRASPTSRRIACWSALGLGLLLPAAASADPLPEDPERWRHAYAAAAQGEELLVAVTLNGRLVSSGVRLLRQAGRLYARAGDLDAWRIAWPTDAPTLRLDDAAHVELAAIPSLDARFDERAQRLDLQIPLSGLRPVELDYGMTPLPRAAVPERVGAFASYGLSGYQSNGASSYSGLFGAGVFGRLGVLSTEVIASGGGSADSSLVRLDTTWRYDLPERMLTAVVGDSLSAPAGIWGRPLRFGGLQFGTNFGTQPGYATAPLQSIAGTAAVPSVVDILVNGQRIGQRTVPAGNFTINDVPYVTGAGNVQAVVRDPLGREQLYAQSYYVSSRLLAQGLDQWGVEAGALRYGYGVDSWDYRDFIAAGFWRRGITNALTGEVRAQVTGDVRLAGASIDASLFERVNGTFSAAWSSSDRASGGIFGVGVQRYAPRGASFSVQYTGAAEGFRQPGDPEDRLALRDLASASVGLPLGRFGSLAAGYTSSRFRGDRPGYSVGTLSYYLTLPRDVFLSLNVSHGISGMEGTTATVNLTIPFGDRRTYGGLGANWNSDAGRAGTRSWQGQASVTRNLPIGDGYGYRVAVREGGDYHALGAVQNAYAQLQGEAGRLAGADYGRLTLSGGAVWLDGKAELARDVTQSFALVDLGGVANAPVYLNNQYYGRTRSDGTLVVSRLVPYAPAKISLQPKDFPLSYSLGETTKSIAPYYRSGSVVRFDVRQVRDATARLKGPDGRPLRAGSVVRVNDRADTYVGLDGEVFLRGLEARNTLQASIDGSACRFEFEFPVAQGDDIPDVGELVCRR
jgi:outer membrane usher protein